MSRFMETQVTKRIKWATCELMGDVFMIPLEDYEPELHGVLISEITGYGVRESAPGYLDCTEWEVLNTLGEARRLAAAIDAEYEDQDA